MLLIHVFYIVNVIFRILNIVNIIFAILGIILYKWKQMHFIDYLFFFFVLTHRQFLKLKLKLRLL